MEDKVGHNKLLLFIDRFSYVFEKIAETASGILVAVMTIVVWLGVFFRYFLHNSLLWSEELSRYVMIWMALLAISIAFKRDEHIGLTFVIGLLSRKLQVIVRYFIRFWILFFMSVLLGNGYIYAFRGLRKVSASLGVTMFWFRLAVPVAALLVIIQIISITILELCHYKDYEIKKFDDQIYDSDVKDQLNKNKK